MLCRVLTVKSLDPEGAVHLADLQVPLLAKKDIAGNTTGGKGDWISTGLYTSDPTISPLTLPSFCACVGRSDRSTLARLAPMALRRGQVRTSIRQFA